MFCAGRMYVRIWQVIERRYMDRQVLYDVLFFFFFNDTATTEIYTLSLHDALSISYTQQFGRYAVDFRPLQMVKIFNILTQM